VGDGVTLTLRNITFKGITTNNKALITVDTGGKLVMEDGAFITGNINDTSSAYGGGVYVDGGSFEMSGGEISGNKVRGSNNLSNGGGVLMNDGSFMMTGGKISDNTAHTSGGGVKLWSGTFTMHGGEISNNTADNGGGAVSMGSNASFIMTGGKISQNEATSYGGGVESDGTFEMSGGEISGNKVNLNKGIGSSRGFGGGVYVSYGTFTMKGGKISGNNTNYLGGGGVYVSYGTFTMHGGEISGNTVPEKENRSMGGGVYVQYMGTFTKAPESGTGSTTSGVIYGYMENSPDGNLVGTRNPDDETPKTHIADRGDAVYYAKTSDAKYRNSTLGEGDHISSTDTTNPLWDN
jgi:hypothetical protein